jgi:heptosyltransferase I
MNKLTSTPQSICILRLSAIGDVCNASTIIVRLRSLWPNVRITWICGKAESQLLALIPDLEVIHFDKSAGIKSYLHLWRQLRGRRFDILLHMQAALRASVASLGISARRRIGFDKARAKDGQWLFCREQIEPANGPHVLDGFSQFAYQLGCPQSPPVWPFVIGPNAIAWAKQATASIGPDYVVLCPAASKTYKNWTLDGYQTVIEQLQEKGIPVVLIGSPAAHEVALAAELESRLRQGVLNLVGQSSLEQLFALLKAARLLISPDTGPAHMAVAMGTPVIGLYAHHNPQRTGPYGQQQRVVSVWRERIAAQSGRSADSLPWRSRVKDPDAMTHVQPSQVMERIEQVLGTHL